MPHDGQDMTLNQNPVLADLLSLTAAALPAVDDLVARAKTSVRTLVTEGDRVSGKLIEENQTAAHGLAWLATYQQSLQQMQNWATRLEDQGKFGEVEQLIHQIAFGEYLWQIYGGIPMSQGEILRLQDIGLTQDDARALMQPAVMTLTQTGNTQAARMRLVTLMQEQSANITVGASGLDDELEMIREQFRRFSIERVEPHAHDWHLKDELIPLEIIDEMAEMGVFGGITIGAEVNQFHKRTESASANIRLLYKAFLTGAWVLIGLTALLVVFVAFRLSHNITGPLSTLIAGTKAMTRGKLGTQVEIDSPVEVAELATAFNTMARQLNERRERLLKALIVLRHSRKEIKQERDFKQTIVENVAVGILTLDSNACVTSLNGVARVILKIEDDNVGQLPLSEILHDFPEFYAAISQSMQAEDWSEYASLERDGRSLTYRLALHPLSSGREDGHILTIEDLTERVNFRQQMARLERLASLGRLSAGIAHEVRNPLTGISLLLDELHDRMLDHPADQGLIQRALQEIERLEGLVNELLNFSSLPEARLAPGDLAVVLRDTLFLVSKQFQKQQVRLHEDVPEVLLHPRMDGDRLKQAILNLFTNALGAMPNGGDLWIAAQRRAGGLVLTIRDTGQGIPADRLDLIFEPFYTTKGEGTGLGLSITYAIIASHGGRIEVQSQEGEGAEFTVYLPDSGQN